ncbi:MAG: hypothetical protein HY044_04860 [Candidatus Woesebacteria bacterium]|nr:MAG: hypothetical protein HY044_04860 [Candidatus Woesebacteria bacterium]
MNAGLPTTGIASIFYFLSIIFMFVNECINIVRKKSNLKRWRFVGKQIFITASIIFAIVGTGYILKMAIPAKEVTAITGINTTEGFQKNTNLIFFTPFIILAILIALTQILRLFFRLSSRYINSQRHKSQQSHN